MKRPRRRVTARHRDRRLELALVDLGERIYAAIGLKIGRDFTELQHLAIVHTAIEYLENSSTRKATILRQRGPDPGNRPETASVEASKQVSPQLMARMRTALGLSEDATAAEILRGIDRQLAEVPRLRAELEQRRANVQRIELEIEQGRRRRAYWEDVREGRRPYRPEFNAPGRPTADELDELDN